MSEMYLKKREKFQKKNCLELPEIWCKTKKNQFKTITVSLVLGIMVN